MLNVIVIDCSHRDRPHLRFRASEVISDSNGSIILSPSAEGMWYTGSDDTTSIDNLRRDIRQGFELHLSSDWTVKVF